MPGMKILCIASEVDPFLKTGGLADVTGALPQALHALGHDVRVVLPFYGQVDVARHRPELALDRIETWLPAGVKTFQVWDVPSRRDTVPVYLLKNDELFARSGIYDEYSGHEFPDNALRYSYFCMAVLWMIKGLGWIPDILHCHDWQAAMIPIYLANLDSLRSDPDLAGCRTLLTIHNLAYQGNYPKEYLPLIGLPWGLFNQHEMEFWGSISLLKGALVHADALTTVSPRYADEITTPDFGCGMEGILRRRQADLHGILNGIDVEAWNPLTDKHLPARFGPQDLSGKAACKAELQRRFGLAVDPQAPMAAYIARLVEQKGPDLIEEIVPEMMRLGMQFVLLGKGWQKYEDWFRAFAFAFPKQVGVEIGFDVENCHLIEAGADLFFMPSIFEPCGLSQMYSMRYGTVPIVRKTGGLADTVIHATEDRIMGGEATGFVFKDLNARQFIKAVEDAVGLRAGRPDLWRRLMLNGMGQDFSWERSACAYERLMEKLLKRPRD